MSAFGGAAFSVSPGFIPETKLLANSDVSEKRLTAAFEDATEKNGMCTGIGRRKNLGFSNINTTI